MLNVPVGTIHSFISSFVSGKSKINTVSVVFQQITNEQIGNHSQFCLKGSGKQSVFPTLASHPNYYKD